MPSVICFSAVEGSFGAVHAGLCDSLRRVGWKADILDWSISYTHTFFNETVSNYEYVLSPLYLGTQLLVDSYHLPHERIIAVAHGEPAILHQMAAAGAEEFEKFGGYGVVSDTLASSSLTAGVRRLPFVVRLGVETEKFRADVSSSLAVVGYGASLVRTTKFGVEQRRGHLARAAAEAAGLEFRPVTTGQFLPLAAMPEYYRGVDAVIMSSLQEGAGLPALEAAAAGRLVIGTPAGHFPRLACEGLGILAPLDAQTFLNFATDTLVYYKANPAAYREKCLSIQAAAARRDWQYVTEDWIELFRRTK